MNIDRYIEGWNYLVHLLTIMETSELIADMQIILRVGNSTLRRDERLLACRYVGDINRRSWNYGFRDAADHWLDCREIQLK